MQPDIWGPVVAALATFAVAVLAYLTAQVRAHAAAIAAQQIALVARGLAAPHKPDAGAGATQRPAPLWNQLADPLPTGALPQYGYEECGEECVAEVIYAQHGVAVEADWLRYQLGGPARRGLTTAADLQRLLALANVAALVAEPPAAALPAELQRICGAGRMAIVLGAWITPGVLHWVLVTRADAQGVGYNDPWGGVRRTAAYRDLGARYAGALVEITRAPDALA
jgi:hypothetical protein